MVPAVNAAAEERRLEMTIEDGWFLSNMAHQWSTQATRRLMRKKVLTRRDRC
jgi:hypothetical protein